MWYGQTQRLCSTAVTPRVITRLQGKLQDHEVKVTNFSLEDKGSTVLAGNVFDVPIRRDIVHRVVRWQLAKRRQGTHCTKSVTTASGSRRKILPQKGTGGARHGMRQRPQFRHGSVAHGPKPRSHEIDLPKKVRRLGLKIALSARAAEGNLMVFDSVEPSSSKTREMARHVEGFGCKKVLFVEGSEKVNVPLVRATENLHYVDVLPVKGLNVYSILQHDKLVMTVDAIERLQNRLHTPIAR